MTCLSYPEYQYSTFNQHDFVVLKYDKIYENVYNGNFHENKECVLCPMPQCRDAKFPAKFHDLGFQHDSHVNSFVYFARPATASLILATCRIK